MSATLRRNSHTALALAMLVFSAPAAGQTTAAALFDEAKVLMKEGAYERACPKIQEAHRLSPTPGTVLTLGDCLEHAGKLASSWGAFKEAEVAARAAKDIDREREAQRRAGLLAPKLARLAIVVPPAARVSGFELKRDGEKIGEGQWGSPLPVDIGAHTIETSAPGRKPWSTVVRIETNGSTASVEVPMMEAAAVPEGPAPFWGGRRIAGAAVGGAGVVGMIVGAGFGARALSRNSESKEHCSPSDPNFCNSTGAALRADAQSAATASTVAFIAGGVALAGGIVLFATAKSERKVGRARIELIPALGGVMLEGRF